MKFYVTKTSTYYTIKSLGLLTKPCEDAFMTQSKEIKEFKEYSKEHNLGYDEVNENIWCIEINSLEELIEFMDKTERQQIVLHRYMDFRIPETEIPIIEIYDDHRE